MYSIVEIDGILCSAIQNEDRFDSILQNEGEFYSIVQNDGIFDTISQNKCKTTRVFTDNENINITVNKTRIRQNNKLIRIHIATSVPSSVSSSKVDGGKRLGKTARQTTQQTAQQTGLANWLTVKRLQHSTTTTH